MEEYHQIINDLLAGGELSPQQQGLMQQLLEYGDSLLA
jgi:hypothetical protein